MQKYAEMQNADKRPFRGWNALSAYNHFKVIPTHHWTIAFNDAPDMQLRKQSCKRAGMFLQELNISFSAGMHDKA